MASFGVVSVSQQVSPDKCHATGKGLEVAKLGERATAVLHVVNNERIVYTKSVKTLICELVSESTGEKIDCSVKKTGASGQYEISYQATSRGRHQLHIKVEGEHIIGSPFPITVIKKLGTPIKTITGGHTNSGEWYNLNRPYGVAVNSNGNIIVTEQEGHCVSVFNPEGEIILQLGSKGRTKGQFDYPRGVTVDNEDNLLVVDAWNKRIQRFASDGTFIAATQLSKKSGLEYPAGIAIHPSSKNLYVADNNNHCIKILNPDLTFSSSFGSYGSGGGQLKNPYDVAFDSAGNVYVADKSNHRIQVFTAEGMYLRQFGSEGSGNGKLSSPAGICIDREDVVYVTEYDNCRVSLFKCDGEFLTSFGSRGREPGQFQSPYGIALDKYEYIYVADLVNDRIQVF